MSYCVIIRGSLGVGKTTVSELLTKAIHGTHISMDAVLSAHDLDHIEGESIPARNFVKANEIALPEVNENLTRGVPVIIDGCFYHREQIEDLQKRISAPLYIFTLKANVATCIHRDRTRTQSYGADAAVAVHALVNRIECGIAIGTEGRTPVQTVEELLKHLPPHD